MTHQLRSNECMSAVGLGPLKLAPLILCYPDLLSNNTTNNGTRRLYWHLPAKVGDTPTNGVWQGIIGSH